MPRTFTKKEREYIARLAARNYEDMEQKPEEGLHQPMPASERMRRKRIRDKAETAVMDLIRADRAGIIDVGDMFSEHNTAIDLLGGGDYDYEGLFWRIIGEEPEQVDIK